MASERHSSMAQMNIDTVDEVVDTDIFTNVLKSDQNMFDMADRRSTSIQALVKQIAAKADKNNDGLWSEDEVEGLILDGIIEGRKVQAAQNQTKLYKIAAGILLAGFTLLLLCMFVVAILANNISKEVEQHTDGKTYMKGTQVEALIGNSDFTVDEENRIVSQGEDASVLTTEAASFSIDLCSMHYIAENEILKLESLGPLWYNVSTQCLDSSTANCTSESLTLKISSVRQTYVGDEVVVTYVHSPSGHVVAAKPNSTTTLTLADGLSYEVINADCTLEISRRQLFAAASAPAQACGAGTISTGSDDCFTFDEWCSILAALDIEYDSEIEEESPTPSPVGFRRSLMVDSCEAAIQSLSQEQVMDYVERICPPSSYEENQDWPNCRTDTDIAFRRNLRTGDSEEDLMYCYSESQVTDAIMESVYKIVRSRGFFGPQNMGARYQRLYDLLNEAPCE